MNKMLRNLLELPTKIDEDIHRGYSRLTRKWEDKGKSRYALSGIFDVCSVITGVNYFLGVTKDPVNIVKGFLYGLNMGGGLGASSTGLLFEKLTGCKMVVNHLLDNPILYCVNKFGKTIRAPELVLGVSLIGKGLYDVYNSLANQDTSSLSEGLSNLTLGTSLASNASAWYVRDSDPEVLDKKPNWKAGLEKLMEYISPVQTEPSSIKIPVKY